VSKRTVVAIDTDLEVLKRFKNRLLDGLRLHNDFDYRQIEVGEPTAKEAAEHCRDVIGELLNRGEDIAIIFVDVAIIERSEPPFDQSGLEIAQTLSRAFPSIPVIGMTRHYNDHRLVSEISLSPHIQGILIKNFFFEHDSFLAQDFFAFVAKATNKVRQLQLHDGLALTLPQRSAERGEVKPEGRFQISRDPQSIYQASEVGDPTLHCLLEKLFPHGYGTARSLRPGFSGSFVFKAVVANAPSGISPAPPLASVVKISRDSLKLRTELENFQRLTTRVKGDFYPSLRAGEVVSVGEWSAIAFDMKEDAVTLLEYLQQNSRVRAAVRLIKERLIPFLAEHYGAAELSKGPVFVWRTYFTLKPRIKAGVNAFVDDARQRVSQHLGRAGIRTLERIKEIVNDGNTFLSEADVSAVVDTRYIHGDLNCRNILVPTSVAKLVFIDFANSKQDHFMKDLAKLEIDLLFLVMDSNRWNDTEWDRITDWQQLLQLYNSGRLLSPLFAKGRLASSVGPVAKLICALRSGVTSISEAHADEEQYLVALLHYALSYLTYPDIQLPKKVFGVSLIGKLLESIRAAPHSGGL
jgi:hypothetical protein